MAGKGSEITQIGTRPSFGQYLSNNNRRCHIEIFKRAGFVGKEVDRAAPIPKPHDAAVVAREAGNHGITYFVQISPTSPRRLMAAYSALMFAALMIGHHFSISAF
jgi:hypothetical protein